MRRNRPRGDQEGAVMGDGVDRFYGFGTYDPPATPMECGNSAALREYERSYQETDEDPLWDAEQAVREDSSVMAEELGSECMGDLWSELHRLIQEPLPWNMPRDEAYRDRFIE